eukprot:g13103.t1
MAEWELLPPSHGRLRRSPPFGARGLWGGEAHAANVHRSPVCCEEAGQSCVDRWGTERNREGEEAEHLAEVKALQTLQHPCILRYYGSVELDETLSLVMEFADAGDLQQLLKEQADSGKLFEVSVSGLDGYSFTVTVSEQLLGQDVELSLEGITAVDGIEHMGQVLQMQLLPNRLQHLSFGEAEDQLDLRQLDIPTLKSLQLGSRFNQSLEQVIWPQNLQVLALGDSFNQSLKEIQFPESLEVLTFGRDFNQPLGITLSTRTPRLRTLMLGRSFLPNSLERLTFGARFDQSLISRVSGMLRGVLPKGLLHLTLGLRFNQSLEHPLAALTRQPSFDSLLSQLRSLTLGHRFDQSLEQLHMLVNLEYLSLGDAFNQGLEEVIWPALQSLHLGARFNQSLERVSLPKSLQRLSFGDLFDQPIRSVAWPEALQMLSFGEEFNQPLQAVWPAGLRGLSFGDLFNQSLEEVDWPPALRSLSFGARFNQSLVNMPNGLESLSEDWREALGDFGVAKVLAGTTVMDNMTCVGSPTYMAPEIVSGDAYGPSCDVRTFPRTQVLFLLISGAFVWGLRPRMSSFRRPFEGRSLGELVMRISSGQFQELGEHLRDQRGHSGDHPCRRCRHLVRLRRKCAETEGGDIEWEMIQDGTRLHLQMGEVYELRFDTMSYFKSSGAECFYPFVTVVFIIHDPSSHYHVPLLISPYGYSTYRGS